MGFVEVFLFPCFDLVLVFQPIPMSLSKVLPVQILLESY